jgi:hypothetical protein
MTLYLANPSLQRHHFHYREPVNNLVQIVEIVSGSQVEIGHSWTADQQAKVISQLELFGARDAAESHGRMGKFMGLLYRDRGFIASNEIEMAHEAETETRGQRSATEATRGALAFDRTVRGKARGRPSARITETSVEEQGSPGERPRKDAVNFGLSVDPEGRSDVALPV